MTRLVLSITTVVLAYTFSPASAPAQAAAESVLLNANSAAATAKAGTALGSALNRATKQLAGQVQEVTHPALGASVPGSPKPVMTPASGATMNPDTTPSTGPLITSISGSPTPSCVPAAASPAAPEKTTQPAPATCANRSDSKAPPQKYKSVVTVTFPQ